MIEIIVVLVLIIFPIASVLEGEVGGPALYPFVDNARGDALVGVACTIKNRLGPPPFLPDNLKRTLKAYNGRALPDLHSLTVAALLAAGRLDCEDWPFFHVFSEEDCRENGWPPGEKRIYGRGVILHFYREMPKRIIRGSAI